ncbi:helix-turn-helix domain-containing protein [Kitasatospora sp. NBC_01250]|uniref:helix-turn-helix domain-containing protein n=1 Tax=unclassified Kitasatospora TaxID=2633591 RepID=UPI002E0E19FC|nr:MULTISPECIES: helix-turn-helix transcriptional regulator [unclassified Kitasatospora]WSJ67729.1 helix-turn-helix domain-containing protein [Kitasatospora sp. NBC_01302]
MSVGALIRALREARGWSQGRLASALCEASTRPTLTREEISRWENGKRSVGPFWLAHLARTFALPVEVFEAAGVGRPSPIGEVARQGLVAALDGRASVDDWQEVTDDYGRAFMTLPAREIEPQLAGDLLLLRRALADSQCLWESVARLSVVMGMAVASLNGPAASARWYRTAVKAADRSGGLALREWTRGQGALALVYEGAEPSSLIAVTTKALALSQRPSMGRLCALLAQAHCYARLGEPGPARRDLCAADEMFPSVASPPFATVFSMPQWGYSLTKTLVHARLGDVEQSQREQDTADRLRPGGLGRFAAHTSVHRALSFVKSGDVGVGLELARRTVAELPAEQRSKVLGGFVAEVKAAARAT